MAANTSPDATPREGDGALRIGILETGPLDPHLAAIDGPYSAMFARLLRLWRPRSSIAAWNVYQDAFPDSAAACDLWIVTGSRYGVYEDPPWMRALAELLRDAHANETPAIGVCFGHQILAHALGGRVIKSDKGWGCGVRRYRLTDAAGALATRLGDETRLLAIHQDQVVEAPPASRVWLSSEFTPIAGLAYGPADAPTALSVQPHPEFSPALLSALLHARRGARIPVATVDEALASIETEPAPDGDGFFLTLLDLLGPVAQRRAARRSMG